MILINLLPHRERARQERLEAFKLWLAGAGLMGVVMAGVVYLWLELQLSHQQAQNQLLQTEIQHLQQQIQSIAGQESEIADLKARQKAVEDLQADRNLPVFFLTDLARLMPEGMYLTSLKQTEQVVMLQGAAQSNERVSEFLRHLANSSPYFSKPELVEITTATASLNAREARRVANFSIRVQLQRTQPEPSKPPAGPNPPAGSKGFPNLSLGNLLPGVKP